MTIRFLASHRPFGLHLSGLFLRIRQAIAVSSPVSGLKEPLSK